MEEPEKQISTEQYSFISLYLFILVFFIILARIVSSPDPHNMIDKFITQMQYDRPYIFSYSSSDINDFDRSQIIGVPAAKLLPQVIFIKEFLLATIMDESGEVSDIFKANLDKSISLIESHDGAEKELRFIINSDNNNESNEKTTRLIKYLSNLKNIKFLIEFNKRSSENSLLIELTHKL